MQKQSDKEAQKQKELVSMTSRYNKQQIQVFSQMLQKVEAILPNHNDSSKSEVTKMMLSIRNAMNSLNWNATLLSDALPISKLPAQTQSIIHEAGIEGLNQQLQTLKDQCNEKIKALLAAKMHPVYCCGESEATFEKGETKKWVAEQIRVGLDGLTPEEAKEVVIAYEPIWAIGTGKSATKEIAEDTIGFIRRTLREMFGPVAADIRILYGGSVKPNNIAEYMSEEDIDGALVGGASLALDSYKGLIEGLVG